MNIILEVEIPRVEEELSISNASLTVENKTELFFNSFVSKNGIPVDIPETTYVWLLSSSIAQPLGTRGIWLDEGVWTDENILYS